MFQSIQLTLMFSSKSNYQASQAHSGTTLRIFFNSAELSRMRTREIPTLSSVTSTESDVVTLDDDFNDPEFPYGFEAQQRIVPLSLNNLKTPPNPFNMLATIALVQANPTQHGDIYSPQSPKSSEPSPISTPPMNLSTIDGWETPHTTTDDNTSNLEDELTRVHWNSSLIGTFHSEGERNLFAVQSIRANTVSQDGEKTRDCSVLSKKKRSSAGCLRSLPTIDYPNKGHSRSNY